MLAILDKRSTYHNAAKSCYADYMEVVVINNIYDHRSRAGLTQEQLAEAVGVTRQTIIAMERGNYTPSVVLALKLAKVFAVPVETLFSIKHE